MHPSEICRRIPLTDQVYAYRRASRTLAYTSAFNELAGPRLDAAVAAAPMVEVSPPVGLLFCKLVIVVAISAFFKQCNLKFFAPACPPPRMPRQNSRPRTVPPKKPSFSASAGSMARKNEWFPEREWSDSRVRDVSLKIEWTVCD